MAADFAPMVRCIAFPPTVMGNWKLWLAYVEEMHCTSLIAYDVAHLHAGYCFGFRLGCACSSDLQQSVSSVLAYWRWLHASGTLDK